DQSQLEVARAVYGTGCSLRMAEHPLWKKCLETLRPAFKLPNRDMMSNSLLERVYEDTVTTAKEQVAAASRMRESITLLLQCPGPYFGAALQQ
ncbi:hypothetical protein Hamer_G026009, partial [Homarus americanus]